MTSFEIHVLLETAPVEWESLINKVSLERKRELVKKLELLSERAGILAVYIDGRGGHGCGDQGHEEAVKNMNRAGKLIHTKAFGYNAYHDLNI